MADGVPGPKEAAAVQLVEGENRGAHGPATIRNLLVEELNVLGHQSKSPTATPCVVRSMGNGAPGLTLEHVVKLAEGAPRLRPGLATIQFLPVGGDYALGVHLKTLSATPTVVL